MEMPFEGRMGGKTEEAFLRSKNKMYKSGELENWKKTDTPTQAQTDRQTQTHNAHTYAWMARPIAAMQKESWNGLRTEKC